MELTSAIPTLAHAIQQSVAPVFLLTGVGSLLGVLVNRLGRIVDRYRQLRSLPVEQITPHRAEMALLQRRSRLIHFAIRYSTLCALLICVVISLLFIGVELGSELSPLIAALFVCGMLSLIASLVCFLKEISLATWRLEAAFDADLRQDAPPPRDGQS